MFSSLADSSRAPKCTSGLPMHWIYLVLAPLVVLFEQQPYRLAKLGFELQIDHKSALKQLLAPLFKYGYLAFRLLHEKIHSLPPQTTFDKLALVIWLKGSLLIDDTLVWLKNQTAKQPVYSQQKDRLIAAYTKVLTKDFKSTRTPGNDGIDWVALGFQGTDPCTDFRAAGMLGLDHFVGFCNNYPVEARKLAQESKSIAPSDDPCWYSLALVSINLTNQMAKLLQQEPVFIACVAGQSMSFRQNFGHIHNKFLIDFHNHWKQEQVTGVVKTVMDTDASIARYVEKIPKYLWDLRA